MSARAWDRLTLAGIGIGIAVTLQPWWPAGLRVGFALTGAFTLAQIVASHGRSPR
jgi:hypothetical protein